MINSGQGNYIRNLSLFSAAALLLFLGSCLRDLPEEYPDEVIWNPSAAFPVGSDTFGMNLESGFDTSLLNLDTITGLPEWVEELEVVMEGSLEFDLRDLSPNLENLRSLLLRINLYNGFPNEVWAQAYFLDPGLNPVDSMFSSGALQVPAGSPVGSGETIQPVHRREDAFFDAGRLDALLDASSILFQATIRNPRIDTTLIPFYPGYAVEVQIGARLDLSLEF